VAGARGTVCACLTEYLT